MYLCVHTLSEQFHESHLFYGRKNSITFPLAKSFSWVNDILSWVLICCCCCCFVCVAIITFGQCGHFSHGFIQQGNLTCPSNDGYYCSGKQWTEIGKFKWWFVSNCYNDFDLMLDEFFYEFQEITEIRMLNRNNHQFKCHDFAVIYI